MVALVILFFVGGYALLQWIFYHRVCRAFAPSWPSRVALAFWLAATVFLPFWSRTLDHAGWGCAAWWTGWTAYTWMVLVFWFGCLTVLVWCWNAVARLVERWMERPATLRLAPRPATMTSFALIAIAACWGLVEVNAIRVHEIVIRAPLIPPSAKPLRLVQISDLHLGKPRGVAFARRIAQKIKTLHPDILVSTGDFVDASTLCQSGVPALFRDLDVPLGKYAVLGNHEYYTGLSAALAFHDAAGFVLLRGRCMTVARSRPDAASAWSSVAVTSEAHIVGPSLQVTM